MSDMNFQIQQILKTEADLVGDLRNMRILRVPQRVQGIATPLNSFDASSTA